jgi:preprotein translocase subunit SecG
MVMTVIAAILAVLFILSIVALVVMAGEWAENEESQFAERRKRLAERKAENDALEKQLNSPF